MELAPGAAITPELRLAQPLSAGAMGSIWVADHAGLRKQVAVKFVAARMARDRTMLARFHREAEAASQIKSANVVRIYEHGEVDGLPYIVMELLKGESLGARLERDGRLGVQLAGKIVRQIGSALDAAHALGIVHRDVKPDNIFLVGRPDMPLAKVLDFGMAKQTRSQGQHQSIITATGVAVGTPEYMSPEQVLGSKDVDYRADLWALGVVAYRMLSGRVPFRGPTPHALFFAICKGDFIPLEEVGVSPALEPWFRMALQPNVDKRIGSAREMVLRFETALASAPPVQPRGAWDDDESTQMLNPRHLQQSQALPLMHPSDDDDQTITNRPPPRDDEDVSTQRGGRLEDLVAEARLESFARTHDMDASEEVEEAATHELDASHVADAIAAALAAHGDPARATPSSESFAHTMLVEESAPEPRASSNARTVPEPAAQRASFASQPDLSPPGVVRPSLPSDPKSGDSSGAYGAVERSGAHALAELSGSQVAVSEPSAGVSQPPSQAAVARDAALAPHAPRAKNGKGWLYAVAVAAIAAAAGVVLFTRSGAGVASDSAAPPSAEQPTQATSATVASLADSDEVVDGAPPATASASATAATGAGSVSIICEPACSEVRVGDQSMGPSPIYKRAIDAGSYRVVLYREGATKTIDLDVAAGAEVIKHIEMVGVGLVARKAAPPPVAKAPPAVVEGPPPTASVTPTASAAPPVAEPPEAPPTAEKPDAPPEAPPAPPPPEPPPPPPAPKVDEPLF